MWNRLRASERLLLVYFVYVAGISPWFPQAGWRPLAIAVTVAALLAVVARIPGKGFAITRDWLALGLMLAAYKSMNWFTPLQRDFHLERAWILWDHRVLYNWGWQARIESTGGLLPAWLEICYALVYAVGPFTLAMLYVHRRWKDTDRVLLLYLLGSLLAYGLFPYFPSEPPRTVFPGAEAPHTITFLRHFNLWVVGGYGIHSSVFPSAHVSSAFSAAWALLLLLRQNRVIGWGMLFYAVSVALATVYGRYHYAVDALAGFGVSLVPLAVGLLMKTRMTSVEQDRYLQ